MSDEMMYYISLAAVRNMLSHEAISENTYHIIQTKLIEKYRPVSAILLSENS